MRLRHPPCASAPAFPPAPPCPRSSKLEWVVSESAIIGLLTGLSSLTISHTCASLPPIHRGMELTAIATRPAKATRDVAFDDPGQGPIPSAATSETKIARVSARVSGGKVRGWADRSGKAWYVGASQRGLPPHERWDAEEAGRYIGGGDDDTAARRPKTPPARGGAQQAPPPPAIGIARRVCASMLVVVIMAFAVLTIFSEIILSPTFESQMVAITATAEEVVQLEVRMGE